jgi:hypothetical protein
VARPGRVRDLAAEIAAAAAESGLSYSAWLAQTASKAFTIRAGLAAVGQFVQEHRAFSAEEIAEAHACATAAISRSSVAKAGGQRQATDRPSVA